MRSVFLILFSVFVVLIFYFTRINAIKFYPALVNFVIFLVFFISLFKKQTIIQYFALKFQKELKPEELIYTRNLTIIWSLFLFFNFLVATITIFLDDKIWIFYNGFLSYILTGTIFMVEYIIRVIFKKRNNL